MKIWLDTEFIEDGKTIDLISIALVAEDGQEFYGEFRECRRDRAGPWVKANVLPHLTGPVMSKHSIVRQVLFVAGRRPEFWGYYTAYDWVAFCQLFGKMTDLPPGWPEHCMDIAQLAHSLGSPPLPVQKTQQHHALADARWNKVAHDFLMRRG